VTVGVLIWITPAPAVQEPDMLYLQCTSRSDKVGTTVLYSTREYVIWNVDPCISNTIKL